MKQLQELKERQKEINLLSTSAAILGWDQETYMVKAGAKHRADQLGLIERLIHEKITDPKFLALVNQVKKKKLSKSDQIMIRELEDIIKEQRKLPKKLVEQLTKARSLSTHKWQEAREKKDFSIFAPYLDKVIKLTREEAKYRKIGKHPYDAMLDKFEKGMRVTELDNIFGELKPVLKQLHKDIMKRKWKKVALKISRDKQEAGVKAICKWMDMPETTFRVDVSTHPFTTTLGPDDVRITTAYRDCPEFSLTSTAHEAGHALYELGLPKKYRYTAVYDAASVGVHESQSRFWEQTLVKSMPFWDKHFKELKKIYGLKLSKQEWFDYLIKPTKTPVRLEADEVSYILHIILRYEIEKEILEGKVKTKDLEKLWNKKSKEIIGLAPKNSQRGILQDVHWSFGYFGYFPTYALGSLWAAQIHEQLLKEMPKEMKTIDAEALTNWLRKNIHSKGKTMSAKDIMRKCTGKELSPEPFVHYIKKKYGLE